MKARRIRVFTVAAALALASPAGYASGFDGGNLALFWGLPFAGILLSLALFPTFAPEFWHCHYGKVALGWAMLFIAPFAWRFGPEETVHQVAHALLLEYLPFVVVLGALYTVAGGICVFGDLHGSPTLNTGLLAIGAALASVMGTTGAAMLMIRPVIRANESRRHRVHTVIFFIFLVANAGGALTPLGDPPLFLGFLAGIDFFWTTRQMLWPTVALCAALLAIFLAIDSYFYRSAGEKRPPGYAKTHANPVRVSGKINFLLLGAVVGTVLMSGTWKPNLRFEVLGTPLELQNVVRDALLLAIAGVSLAITPKEARAGNRFAWEPIREVAKLFFAIFITIVPVIAELRAGRGGALGAIVDLVTRSDGAPDAAWYFWLTGLLSAFLDNAPTYLVFFNLAGGDPTHLMAETTTLRAISSGAVFMGALTYVGNAPNFMIKAIAQHCGISMPGFFGYMAWSLATLGPLFVLMTWLFYR